jgi:hypothetical protein
MLAAFSVAVLSSVAAADVVSSFNSSDEGWRLVGESTSVIPTWIATGGDPGGFLRGFDSTASGAWYWDAPAQFLGDKSGAYFETLIFSMRSGGSGPASSNTQVVLSGNGLQLYSPGFQSPVGSWSLQFVTFAPFESWFVNSLSGPQASGEQILSVLSNLESLRIRGDYYPGLGSGDIDEIRMGIVPSPPASSLLLCAGLTLARRRRMK